MKEELESELGKLGIRQFITWDEDDDQYFSYMDPDFLGNSYSNEWSCNSYTYVSMNNSLSSEIDPLPFDICITELALFLTHDICKLFGEPHGMA